MGAKISRESFLWAWLCLNTRCVYYDLGLPKKDNLTMAPFFDLVRRPDLPQICRCLNSHSALGQSRCRQQGERSSVLKMVLLIIGIRFKPRLPLQKCRYGHRHLRISVQTMNFKPPWKKEAR